MTTLKQIMRIALTSILASGTWIPMTSAGADAVAFPGAEGAGAQASGGRAGEVFYVTNLNDKGPGSLRDALRRDGRTVLFKVSGNIDLIRQLNCVASNITIAGESAPGMGICLRGKPLMLRGDNIIVRNLRLRPGDLLHEEHDALTISGASNVIVDHCSLSWSTDSVNDVVRDSSHVTVQWCILSEPLNASVHSKGSHGYGTGWGSGPDGGNSFHHNLLAHCNSRSPRIGSEKNALVDVRNNVIYDMGSGWAYGGEHARVNYVANYYKPGPSTKRPGELFRVSHVDTRIYLAGNVIEGQPNVSANNFLGLTADGSTTPNSHSDHIDLAKTVAADEFDMPAVATSSPAEAYKRVLEFAGAIQPERDSVDRRIVAEVRNGTGSIINSQSDVGGWPELESASPPDDSDNDGIPDSWELAHNLDPQDASDGPRILDSGYTSLEQYLHELAAVVQSP